MEKENSKITINVAPGASVSINDHVENQYNGCVIQQNVVGDTANKEQQDEVVEDCDESLDMTTICDAIMEYVGRLKEKVPERWKDGYERLWQQIIADPSVAAVIYNKGKQQNTTFNRKLVANIIHYLAQKGVYDCDSATVFAKALEGNKDHSVRAELGNNPEDKKINKALEAILVAKYFFIL